MNGLNRQNYIANNQATLAAFTSANSNNNMSSEHTQRTQNNQHQLPPHLVNQLLQIEASLRSKHPNTPADQIRQAAQQHFIRLLNSNRQVTIQTAMNTAVGSGGQVGLSNGVGSSTSPHQYAQLLRAQQEAQARQQQAAQAAAAAAVNGSSSSSRAASQSSPTLQSVQQPHQRSSSVNTPQITQSSPPAAHATPSLPPTKS